jgi:hypothetical protein
MLTEKLEFYIRTVIVNYSVRLSTCLLSTRSLNFEHASRLTTDCSYLRHTLLQ